MKLTFLGTRGYIEPRSRRHYRHSATRVEYLGAAVLIDCGEDWRDELAGLAPDAIVLTHAHPDHTGGLTRGARCPVHATAATWDVVADHPIDRRETIEPREPREIAGITFEAFPVEHSIRAPAVGYRVTAGRVSIFYVPDVVYIHERRAALAGATRWSGTHRYGLS